MSWSNSRRRYATGTTSISTYPIRPSPLPPAAPARTTVRTTPAVRMPAATQKARPLPQRPGLPQPSRGREAALVLFRWPNCRCWRLSVLSSPTNFSTICLSILSPAATRGGTRFGSRSMKTTKNSWSLKYPRTKRMCRSVIGSLVTWTKECGSRSRPRRCSGCAARSKPWSRAACFSSIMERIRRCWGLGPPANGCAPIVARAAGDRCWMNSAPRTSPQTSPWISWPRRDPRIGSGRRLISSVTMASTTSSMRVAAYGTNGRRSAISKRSRPAAASVRPKRFSTSPGSGPLSPSNGASRAVGSQAQRQDGSGCGRLRMPDRSGCRTAQWVSVPRLASRRSMSISIRGPSCSSLMAGTGLTGDTSGCGLASVTPCTEVVGSS